VTREFVHAVTGRSIIVAEGSRTERLVVGDANWTEADAKKTTAKKTTAKKTTAKKAPADEPESD
jgi:uncharacterized cupin superfamily protein